MAIDPSDIKKLKTVFGPIFKVNRGDTSYICRTITRAEAKSIGMLEADVITSEIENHVFALAVIDPIISSLADVDEMPAVDVTEVAQKVLEKSGLLDADHVNLKMEQARDVMSIDVYANVSAVIVAAFPTYNFDMLDDLHIDALMLLLAQAEKVNEVKRTIYTGEYGPLAFMSRQELEAADIYDPETGRVDMDKLSDEEKDQIIRQKLLQGAATAGIVDGSFQGKQFGIRSQSDKSGREIIGTELERF